MITSQRFSMREAVKLLDPKAAPEGMSRASDGNSASEDWDLNAGYETSYKYARFGWQEQAKRFNQLMLSMATKTVPPDNWNYAVSGAYVDVALYLEGEPECMVEFESEPDKMIEVMVPISTMASIDAEYMFNRGSAIASIVYSLLCSSYKVRLEVVECIGESWDRHLTRIVISEFGDILDPARFAYWLVHPAALRRSIFRLNEQNSEELRENFGFYEGGGYGSPRNYPKDQIPDGALYFPIIDSDNYYDYATPASAKEAVHKVCRDFGLVLG